MAGGRDDLTGAALVALMRLAFERQGIGWPAAPPPRRRRAHASLLSKEAAAEAVLARHGPLPLLRVGDHVTAFRGDPAGAVLLSARDAPALFARWQRLERYLHTRHPIILRTIGDREALLDHRGNPEDPPSPAIDLVLAGLFRGLLLAIGCGGVRLSIGEGDRRLVLAGPIAGPPAPALPSDLVTGVWHFSFDPPPPGKPELVVDDVAAGGLVRRLGRLIERDLLHRPSLAEAAAEIGLSPRTLQRRLAEEGIDWQSLRREAQIRQAARLLREGAAGLDAIGYGCGFADAAHFSRAFRARAGLSPRAYRDLARQGGVIAPEGV